MIYANKSLAVLFADKDLFAISTFVLIIKINKYERYFGPGR